MNILKKSVAYTACPLDCSAAPTILLIEEGLSVDAVQADIAKRSE